MICKSDDTGAAAGSGLHPGFTNLVNGHELAGWRGLIEINKRMKMSPAELATAQAAADEKMRAHWRNADGVLEFDGHGESLATGRDYQDFELFVDWKINKGGDSGIYLRGTPQVQIWDNPIGSGGLYNNAKHPKDPLVVADHPPGEWNTFRIIMIGENVTVWLNDKLVVDHTPLENYWDKSIPVYDAGPVELQNHGDRLWFKNIYIKEIPRNR
ncbi:MAG: DUF1080 domain-containing protein [Planctomycetes bacterium]|nr:DUF1080 domain-containing protein [Planctomycetota bacterium]